MNPSCRRQAHMRLAFLILVTLAGPPAPALAQSAGVVISQVYGGGGNSGAPYQNDYVELHNVGSSPVALGGWSVQYASSAGTTWLVTPLSGAIGPGQYYLIQEAAGAGNGINLPPPDAVGSTSMSASSGKVALVNGGPSLSGSCPLGGNVVDFVGYGTANCFEGGGAAPGLSNTTAALRNSSGCADTDNNAGDFAAGAPSPRNTASSPVFCGTTAPSGVGAANPSSLPPGAATNLGVAVTPGANPPSTGLGVACDLSAIGGSPGQMFFDDGTNGDATPGDNTFSFQAVVASGTTPGTKSLPVTIADAQSRTGTATISLTVEPPLLPIHDIQGSGASSPFAGQVVTTSGIVTGRKSNGFFIQTTDVDADPNTSEGIVVFTSSTPPATAAIGNLVQVTGSVSEFVPSADPGSPPTTELTGATVVVVSSGNALPSPVILTAADTDPAGPIEQLEKYEGMRVKVNSLTVASPTRGSVNEASATATSDGVFYGVITGIQRPFREPGVETPDPLPAGSPCCVPRFDANPERLRVDSDGQVGATALEVTAGATVTDLVGPFDYAFRTYTIVPDAASPPAVTGNTSAVPVPLPGSDEFTIASFSLSRLFDTVDDPAINEPVLTPTAFDNRLNKASLAIRNVMRAPDIIGVQEAENFSTLGALATRVNSDAVAAGQPNPSYSAYLAEGNDAAGIDCGFLVKGSRVTVSAVTQEGKNATYINPDTGQPELLNDRPPLRLNATITAPDAAPFPLTVINNHLRSLFGIESTTSGDVRAKRRAQAEFLANLVQARQAADPSEHIVLEGDFNAFPFNDGYVDVIGTIKGTPTPPDQVVLASSDLVDPDLTDLVDSMPATERYSFAFDGNAQVLDHVLVTQSLVSAFRGLSMARNGADFPETYRNDPNRPERVSEHDMPVAYFRLQSQTGVDDGTSRPQSLALGRPAPNPAGRSVIIWFSLPTEALAQLEFLDIAGRVLARRGLSGYGVGTHRLVLDEPADLSAGIYTLRIRQGARTIVRRLVVVH